ncbi:MAG: Ig-like domain-containing protein [Gemmatimonadota bacterium]
MMSSSHPHPLMTVAALLVLEACGGASSTGPGDNAAGVASVSIEPGGRSVFVDGSLQLSARARDADGVWIPGTSIAWSSSDQGIATVNGSGRVTGISLGTGTITASVGRRLGTAEVTVSALTAPVLDAAISTSSLVALSWTRTSSPGTFDGYEIFRATIPGVTRQSTLVTLIVNLNTAAFIDRTVESDQAYHYRVFERANDGATVGSNEVSTLVGGAVELSAIGSDMAFDPQRGRMYISLPILNEVSVVSLATNEVVARPFVGSRPEGVDLSDDGSTLYVALSGAGSITALDTDTFARTEIVIGDSLGDTTAWDVAEGAPGKVFVSANPNGGFAWIVRIDRHKADAYRRVASNRIIRGAPEFLKSPDRSSLYIGEGFSPNSLYRLDIRDPSAPIVLEDDHGSVRGTSRLGINPAGTRIYTRNGQVLRSGSFVQAGLLGSGVPAASPDGSEVFVGTCQRSLLPETCTLEVYDAGTLLIAGAAAIDGPEPGRIIPFPDGSGAWVLSGDILYSVTIP